MLDHWERRHDVINFRMRKFTDKSVLSLRQLLTSTDRIGRARKKLVGTTPASHRPWRRPSCLLTTRRSRYLRLATARSKRFDCGPMFATTPPAATLRRRQYGSHTAATRKACIRKPISPASKARCKRTPTPASTRSTTVALSTRRRIGGRRRIGLSREFSSKARSQISIS